MAASGALLVSLVAGTVLLVRGCGASGRALRALTALASAAVGVIGLFTLGALCWIASVAAPPAHQPANLFDLGLIDVAGTAAMALALWFALRQRRRLLAS
jgi:hypothetical protein